MSRHEAAARMEFLDLPGNPVPPGASVLHIVTADGIRLRAARFRPNVGSKVVGTVCLFQGRGEQIEKYFAAIGALQRRGFHIVAFDWRGQGGSQRLTRNPRKGHVSDFRHYERDIDAVRRHVALPDCPPPYFALGPSMGGHILLRAAPRLRPWISRMVLASPFFDFGKTPLGRRGIRTISAPLRWMGLGRAYIPRPFRRYSMSGGFEGNPLTSDPAKFSMMVEIARARPDLTIGAPTIGWIDAAVRSVNALDDERFVADVSIPVLLVNAGADRVVSVLAVERMARRIRGAGYVLIPGARHELLMERDLYSAQFWAAFDAFVPGGGPV
jgi:lysophospholipase